MINKFKSLKDHVYDYIADQIAVGNLRPEEKINEASICEELSISRTPVREALIQLSSEGILDNVPRKGFVVKSLTEKEAQDLYVIIGNLDGLVMILASPRLTEKDFHDMQFYIDSMDLAINSKNYEMYMAQQKAFHQVYTAKCGNDALIDYLEKMKNKFIKGSYADESETTVEKTLKETNTEHQHILNLLKEGKAEKASEYIAKVHWSTNNAHFESLSVEDE